jgi:molybdate transport system ATP-binding protein
MLVRDLFFGALSIEFFELLDGECWCIVGANGSGKSLFAAVLSGEVDAPGAKWEERPESVHCVSFEAAQARYEEERQNDDTDFLDRQDWGSTGYQILKESGASDADLTALCEKFCSLDLLERGCRQYSSGEWRRIELLKAILLRPSLLILDEPFEALDERNRIELLEILERLVKGGQKIVLLLNRLAEVPIFCHRLALLQQGKLVASGPRDELLSSAAFLQLFAFDRERVKELPEATVSQIPDPLVEAKSLSVAYDGIIQFAPFDWKLRPGEHTRIVGPNGSGKSTLLQLLTGDHPQCYGNDLTVVGYRRGTGESIWDVKARIGIVSPALHRDYRAAADVLSVVLSGLFDSIGLYQKPSPLDVKRAEQWLELFDLHRVSRRAFRSLSYGQQRLVLIARALIKQPPLLILDEPTQGLDDLNRKLVLLYLERLVALKRSTLLFVSHHQDEVIVGFRHELRFIATTNPREKFRVELGVLSADC